MRALTAAERPMLLTALSADDAARDLAFVAGLGGRVPALERAAAVYEDNPFGSLLGGGATSEPEGEAPAAAPV